MNELDQKILNSLTYNIPTNVSNLMTKTGYGNKNYFVEAIDRLEKQGNITTRKDGRERLIIKPLPIAETVKFVKNYGGTLNDYRKFFNNNLKKLEKNMPLVPETSFPMKKVKTREPVLKFDKKKKMYTVQGTREGHGYTWRTKPKPLKYFNAILNALNRLFQESSAISFSEFIDDNPSIKEYQKKSKMFSKA